MDDEDGAFEERPLRIERHHIVEHLDHELAALQIGHVAGVRTLGVHKPVLGLIGIEMGAGGFEVGGIALPTAGTWRAWSP
jgi:hypothetical protein